MDIPDEIKRAVDGNSRLSALINNAITVCKDIISTKPEFFPEYTDHGPDHSTEVLNTAIDILTSETVNAMSPEDYTVLALSVLFHDCGMHMTGDSFVSLISENNHETTILDDKTWKQLWNDFLLEVKRFDGKQNCRVFGSPEPAEEPPSDPADYTLKHRLLIGEFLRRHHPRLAHEIAIFGFPTIEGGRIKIPSVTESDLLEISGLVARSHGMSLRQACDHFSEHFHEREYQGVHPPIVMAALRIADYLQVQPERAPQSALKIQRLRSPFSSGEWRVHQSVRNITPADNDPEAIYVDARPQDVSTFLKFQAWANGFQSELDTTWAALGEVYGRFSQQGFDKFGLRLRRLRTNIDNVEEFSQSVDYLPDQVAFEASSADLLSLLVAPLYGDRPEIGLRELIQNSLDAVCERRHIECAQPTEALHGHDTDVIVYPVMVNKEVAEIIIEDRGIGMNADIVKNYFQRAGASFRYSSQWNKNFTADGGGSEIAITGRFGVGALAGFLIGEKITVETRRLGEEIGLVFDAALDQESIELKYCNREVGTKIKIRVGKGNISEIKMLFGTARGYRKWDWYCLKEPKLIRVNSKVGEIKPEFIFEDEKTWSSVDSSAFARVVWAQKAIKTEKKYGYKKLRGLFVNGIFVRELEDYGDGPTLLESQQLSRSVRVSHPTVLLDDHDGRTNLSLQRNSLTKVDKELSDSLRSSITRDLVAQALAFAPEKTPFSIMKEGEFQSCYLNANFSLSTNEHVSYRTTELSSPWCWEDGGWRLEEPTLSMKKKMLLAIYSDYDLGFLAENSELLADVSIVWTRANISSRNKADLREALRHVTRDETFLGRSGETSFNGQKFPVGFEIVVSKSAFKKLSEGGVPRYLDALLTSRQDLKGDYVRLTNFGQENDLSICMQEGLATQPSDGFAYAMVGGASQYQLKEQDIFVHLWSKLVGSGVIPLSFEDRKDAFPEAFAELGTRIFFYRDKLK